MLDLPYYLNDRIIAHTHITAHPQTMEKSHIYFLSLFNVRIKAHPQTLENPNLMAHGR